MSFIILISSFHRMHILLLPFGSSGDVFPYIWLGRQLLARGHRVTMITGQGYAEQARAAGLALVEDRAMPANNRCVTWRRIDG